MVRQSLNLTRLALFSAFLAFAGPVSASENLTFVVAGNDPDLRAQLRAASLVKTAVGEDQTEPRELFAAALADYSRLLETLYANGYYSGVINIRIDGREAADIPLLAVPSRISTIAIDIQPGPPFRLELARVAPLAPGTDMPQGFKAGNPARSVVIADAVDAAVGGWRNAGYAKVQPAGQSIVADHAKRTLSADVRLDPGPLVRFGDFRLTTPSAVRAARVRRIAGFPSGEIYSPEALERVTERLRRTGAFSSVSLTESESLGAGNTMDISLALADEKPRRYGFGAEVSSMEGLLISGFWLHRNLLGGAERLRIDGEIANIGGNTGGIDYSLGVRFETPAVLGPDTKAFAVAKLERLDEPSFLSDQLALGFGVGRRFSDHIQTEAGLTFMASKTEDGVGRREFALLTFPVSGSYDKRDDQLDPTRGFFANLEITPYVGLDGSESGARVFADGRIYRGIGADNRVVVAGRLQFGSVVGSAVTATHPDFLFYSGGGGTVRGQPYQSLDVDLGGGVSIGGRSFVGVSTEIRAAITDKIGAVAFFDAGYIGAESFYDGSGGWHSGAGLGLRYKTGVGPIRFDVATPVGGSTGQGVQVYIGIGQAF